MDEVSEEIIPISPPKEVLVGINYLKAILLVCMVCYHAFGKGIHTHFLSFWGLGILMPLMAATSGYLINVDHLKQKSFIELCKKYWDRMIKDWLVVVIVMYIIDLSFDKQEFSVWGLIHNIIFPRHHLWYIPCLFGFIILFWGLLKLNLSDIPIFIISLFISVAYGFFYTYGYLTDIVDNYTITEWVFYNTFRPHFFIFFICGNFVRHYYEGRKTHKTTLMFAILFFLSFIWRNKVFFDGLKYFLGIDFYIFTILSIFVIFPWIKSKKLKENSIIDKSLKKISQYSLEIYLWHGVFIIFQYLGYF